MAEEKTDFEKGVEALDRERKGGLRNENYEKALRATEDKPQRPEIFQRVHERYLEEDRKGHFIKGE